MWEWGLDRWREVRGERDVCKEPIWRGGRQGVFKSIT